VRTIRRMRPGSLESNAQHDFVWAFSSAAWKDLETYAGVDAAGGEEDKLSEAGGGTEIAHLMLSNLDADRLPAPTTAACDKTVEGVEPVDNSVCHDSQISSEFPPPFPRTPHSALSPGSSYDDIFLSATSCTAWDEVVVTEKIDGGNCCLSSGRVFARSHARETALPWFTAAKQIAQQLTSTGAVPDHIALFVENLEAIHSIDYGHVASPVYVFGAVDLSRGNLLLSWDDVCLLAQRAMLPVGEAMTELQH